MSDSDELWGAIARWKRLGCLDLNATRLRCFQLRHSHVENTVLEHRLNAIRVRPLRETDRAEEGAEAAFGAEETFLLFTFLMCAFTSNGEDTILELNLNLVRLEAREIESSQVRLVSFRKVESGCPAGGLVACKRREQLVKELVEILAEPEGRLEPSECVHSSRGIGRGVVLFEPHQR